MEINEFSLRKSPSKSSFRHRIHSLLRRADARVSADIIIYRMLRISLVCGSGYLLRSESRSRL